MFPSPKYIFFGLSGAGLVGGSVAAWQLTKNNNLKSLNIRTDAGHREFERRLEEKCGDEDAKNRNFSEYEECRHDMLERIQNS